MKMILMMCAVSAANASLREPASSAFTLPPTPGGVQLSVRQAAGAAVTDDASTTQIMPSDDVPRFQIREANYADLSQAADLMTDGFYPELRENPLLRPFRYLLELGRLQGNFPYEEDGRHYYLVAYEHEGLDAMTTSRDNRKVIGFCDIDGRIPEPGRKGFSFSPSFTQVNRPQPYFSDLAVHPDHRRQGIALALMKEAERRATSMGFEELYLGVRRTNHVALQMYSRIGYESIIPSGDMLAFLDIQKDVKMLRRSLDQ
ncbi:hypothetical protein ACHAWF_002420 [Thalassiosira exigua]